MTESWNQPRQPIITDHYDFTRINPSVITAETISVPEPLEYAIQAGDVQYGLAAREVLALDTETPIFQDLVNRAVQRQIKHEEAQLRAWLAAIINDPAGRKIIEEML